MWLEQTWTEGQTRELLYDIDPKCISAQRNVQYISCQLTSELKTYVKQISTHSPSIHSKQS